MITQLVRQQIKNMQEINWGEVPENNPYRLLWGENQQSLAIYKNAVRQEIEKINLYPSTTKVELREKLASYNNVKPENIVLTNGSDEALELIAKVFINENDDVVIPSPSYPGFASVSEMMGANIIDVNLEKNFSLNGNKLEKVITKRTKIIWIANPNNPTGNMLMSNKQIKNLIKNFNCLFVIDECYFELTGITAAQLIKQFPNVIVTRSFSKVFALAGVRLGYVIANEQVTNYLNRLQQTNLVFSINRFAYAAGLAIMDKPSLIQKTITSFIKRKKLFEKELQNIGIEIFPTFTTFCFAKLPDKITGKQLKEKLVKKNIYIKDCSIYEGLGKQFIYLGIPGEKYQKECIVKIKEALEE